MNQLGKVVGCRRWSLKEASAPATCDSVEACKGRRGGCWFTQGRRELVGRRKRKVRGKRNGCIFLKSDFDKITILALRSLNHNSHTVNLIWLCHMSTNSYRRALHKVPKLKQKITLDKKSTFTPLIVQKSQTSNKNSLYRHFLGMSYSTKYSLNSP